MNSRKEHKAFPQMRLDSIKLINLWYRSKKVPGEILADSESRIKLSGNVRYTFLHKRKKGFTMRAVSEIQVEDLLFRARHVAKFVSLSPIDKNMYDKEEFTTLTVNMVMPFCSELFAYLSGKTVGVPFIAPNELPRKNRGNKGD